MKLLSLPLLALLLGACSQNTESMPTADILCEDPRPEICTMEYAPVCAIEGAELKEYSNGCSACSNPEVSGYLKTACEVK